MAQGARRRAIWYFGILDVVEVVGVLELGKEIAVAKVDIKGKTWGFG
jgi:hypothetical protein